jgi:hypothetical protein
MLRYESHEWVFNSELADVMFPWPWKTCSSAASCTRYRRYRGLCMDGAKRDTRATAR